MGRTVQVRRLFGDDEKTADGDGNLSFCEYLDAVNVRFTMNKKGGKKGKRGKGHGKNVYE